VSGGRSFTSFESNTSEPEARDTSAWAQMYPYFMGSREKVLEHYHQQPNVETVYSMMKGKFGDSLRSKSDVGQSNEALCKVLCTTSACWLGDAGAMYRTGLLAAD
jgi:hypothetical protein